MDCEDADQATAGVGRVFHPHSLTRIGPVPKFRADLRAVVTERITAGRLRYNSNSDLYCPTIEGYHVNVPLSGYLMSESRGTRTVVQPGRAVIYMPGSDARICSPENSKLNMFAMKFDGNAIRTALQDLLGTPVDEPLKFRDRIDLSSGDGRAWWNLVLTTYRSQLRGSMMLGPHLSDILGRSIILGLLSISEHQYAGQLRQSGSIGTSTTVDRAVDFIEANAGEPITSVDVARAVGMSLRALQRGFKTNLDTTPMEMLRNVRMKYAHQALTRGNPERDCVSSIASAWGFSHYGRFAQEYRRIYGVSPSMTLRDG
jgi:AraC-like DNA-binding protein